MNHIDIHSNIQSHTATQIDKTMDIVNVVDKLAGKLRNSVMC